MDQRFQVGILLLGAVQRVLVRLHLTLETRQDLQIALRFDSVTRPSADP